MAESKSNTTQLIARAHAAFYSVGHCCICGHGEGAHDSECDVAIGREVLAALEGWRSWAQFVFLNGGQPEIDDNDMQRLVVQAYDRAVLIAVSGHKLKP